MQPSARRRFWQRRIFALLKRLLAQDGGCAVFLLGEAEEAELERAYALGLEDVIAAPFSATTAKMRMARALADVAAAAPIRCASRRRSSPSTKA